MTFALGDAGECTAVSRPSGHLLNFQLFFDLQSAKFLKLKVSLFRILSVWKCKLWALADIEHWAPKYVANQLWVDSKLRKVYTDLFLGLHVRRLGSQDGHCDGKLGSVYLPSGQV